MISLLIRRSNHRLFSSATRLLAKNDTKTTSNQVKKVPVVTIMGHVDHGKTTLLDHLRNSQIVKTEFGGITQHIGAFVVPFVNANTKQKELVTFLDTPGHAAFAAMRQRGANVTDIVVLVIAAEDGILDQTVESINFAKNSDVPIIVAVNKIDKFTNDKNLQKSLEIIRTQLITHNLTSEQDGGEVQLIKMSALRGSGIDDLKESILALAETLNLQANIACPVSGRVIESKLDPHRGKLSTILVQEGVLTKGDYVVAGSKNWAKVRALFDERGQTKQDCSPGLPIQVIGWREDTLPFAGDEVIQVPSESDARKIVREYQAELAKERALYDAEIASKKAEEHTVLYREKLLEKRSNKSYWVPRISFTPRGVRPKQVTETDENERKIGLLIKSDVHGSQEALLNLLDTYDPTNSRPVKLDLIHFDVGPINEGDIALAAPFENTVIYGFNVKMASQKVLPLAKKSNVELKMFNVIYHLIDDLKQRIEEKMPTYDEEVEVCQAQVLQQFHYMEKKQKVVIAGCKCTRGTLKTNFLYRLKRGNQVLADELTVRDLKHRHNTVSHIEKDKECGITFENLPENLEYISGDVLVGYERQPRKHKLKWDLKGFA